MGSAIPKKRAIVFALLVVLFLLGLLEYVCRWEETIAYQTRPSLLEYQQVPGSFFEKQRLADGREVFRTVGVTASYQAVPVVKGEGELRIGILGGSAVAGMGYAPSWSFAGMLQRLADQSGKKVRVINLGRVGYSSRQLIVLASSAIRHLELDHLVVYAGHNEFLEVNARLSNGDDLADMTGSTTGVLRMSALYRTLHRWIFSMTRHTADTDSVSPATLPLPEGVHQTVLNEFLQNLSDIHQLARGHCEVTFCTVPANLEFGPTGKEPFYLDPDGKAWNQIFRALAWKRLERASQSTKAYEKALDLAPAEEGDALTMLLGEAAVADRVAFRVLDEAAEQNADSMTGLELFTLAAACKITNQWAPVIPFEASFLRNKTGTFEGIYAKGRLELEKGNRDVGRNLLNAARDLDLRRVRIPSDFNTAIRRLAGNLKVNVLELDSEFWSYDHFNDYCHFNLEGNLAVAQHLYAHLFGQQPAKVPAPNQWLAQRNEDFTEPWWYLGVNADLWKVYTQRPASLSAPATDREPEAFTNDAGRLFYANRMLFSWAGSNQNRYGLMERHYIAASKTQPGALWYFYNQEGPQEKAEQLGFAPSISPFPPVAQTTKP